jgi:hypothetical protein
MLSSVAALQNDTATITWQGDHSHPVEIDYFLSEIGGDTTAQMSGKKTFAPADSARVKISMQGYKRFRYKISSVAEGTVHPDFRGGKIQAVCALSYL